MPEFPLHTDSNDRHRTFIIVVAWFFTLLGATNALKALGQLIMSHWTLAYSTLRIAHAVVHASELLFSVAAVIVGLGMLNQRATALRNAVVLLWLYFFWAVGVIGWGVIKFVQQAPLRASLASEASDVAHKASQSGIAYFVYANVTAVVSCVICVWLARRLSLPIIKATYAA
jgi:hypothetical protein